MVPPELMLTNKICGRALKVVICWLAGMVLLTGCGPPGPRAFLKGERLVEQGKYEKAIPKLQQAIQTRPFSTNAQAWNYLGLAYHGNQQPLLAIRAYRQALSLDSSLTAARFNLGCAYLDHSEVGNAVEQLTSFTYLQPNSVEGWLKLGTAHFRTNRLELAERSFRVALDLQTNNVEALNGLGLVQFQKKRYAEALNWFNLASAQNPKYGPALLNAAIAAHQVPASKQSALRLYRRYLELKPPPADAARIAVVAGQLEAELNPPPVPVRKDTQAVAQVQARTNPVVALGPTQTVATVTVTNVPVPARTNLVVLGPPAPVRRDPPVIVPPPISNAFALTNLITAPESVAHSRLTNGPVEVTQLDTSFAVAPPQELAAGRERPAPVPATPAGPDPVVNRVQPQAAPSETNSPPIVAVRNSTKPPKKGFWEKLNPFSGKPKGSNAPVEIVAAAPTTPQVIVLNSNTVAPPTEAAPEPPPVVTRRYEYQFPAKRPAGNRVLAQKYIREGVEAQKGGLQSEAI